MSKTRGAIFVSSISLYAYQFAGLAFTMYLARTFTPSELGTYGVAVAITMLSSEVRSLGSGEFLVREKVLTDGIVRSSLGLTILISWLLGIVLMAGSDAIAGFYGEVRLELMILLLSIGFFTAPFININSSLLTRHFQFGRIVTLDWCQLLITYAVTIICVQLGQGYLSLVYGALAGTIGQFILVFFLRAPQMHWLPRFHTFSAQLKFGSIASLSSLAEKSNLHSIDLLIGRLGSMYQTAILSKAVSAVELIAHMLVAGAKPVVLPYISQTEKTDLARNYFFATTLATAVCLPALAAMIPVGDLIIYVLFGDQWSESGALIPFLVVWGLFRNLHPFVRSLLISQKHEARFLYLQCVTVFSTIIAILIGFYYGLPGVAIGLALSSAGIAVYSLYVIAKTLEVPVSATIKQIAPSLWLTAVCLALAYGANYLVRLLVDNSILQLLLFGICMTSIWLGSVWLGKHPIYFEGLSVLRKSST